MEQFQLKRAKPPDFRATVWSVVEVPLLGAPMRERAVEYLFRAYWPAVYLLYRRIHRVPDGEARYLCQALFLHLLSAGIYEGGDDPPAFRQFVKRVARDDLNVQIQRRAETGAVEPAHWADYIASSRAMKSALLQADPSRDSRPPAKAFDQDFAECLVLQAFRGFSKQCKRRGTDPWADVVRLWCIQPPANHQRDHEGAIAHELGLDRVEVERLLYKAKQAFRWHIVEEVRGTLPLDALQDRDVLRREVTQIVSCFR